MSTTISALRGPAQRADSPRTIIDLLNDSKVKQGLAQVAGRLLSPDRVMKLVTNAVYRTPALAQCDPKSVLGALMASVSLGLEPNTQQGHAYLIPYKRRVKQGNQWVEIYDCQFQIGYRGLIVLGYRSPRIKTIEGEAIHANDHFKHMKGSRNFLEHEIALTNRGELIGAYCHSHMSDGMEIATVMPLERIYSVRDRSETFRSLESRLIEARAIAEANPRDSRAAKDLERAQRNYNETPWVLRIDEMSSKTAIKRHCTAKMPLDPGDFLRAAVDLDNASERGEVDFSVLADPEAAHALATDGELPSDALAPDIDDDGRSAGEHGQDPAQADHDNKRTPDADDGRSGSVMDKPARTGRGNVE